jgi:plasmid maintenance system antidote protein VapI
MATVSEQIRRAIVEAEVTRYRIAQDTGLDEATLCRFISGERGLSMMAIDRLAEYFGYKLVKSKGK